VGEAANGEAAVLAVAAHQPDVVLMDIRMPGMDGLEATRLLTRSSPAPKVVMLTTFDLDEYVYEALRAGASGFLLKDSPRADLIAAVRAAAAGNAMLAPTITRRLIEAFARRPAQTSPSPARLASLTAREREVLVLLARGSTNTEIADTLFVSEATVKTHVGNLLAKLGLRDRVQAVILAYETGIVVPGDPPAPPTGKPQLSAANRHRPARRSMTKVTTEPRVWPGTRSSPSSSVWARPAHRAGSGNVSGTC
jgi:DNA-binding NarL/FixJ family response regulator